VILILSLCSLTVAGVHDARAETASPEEMELVCQNWLSVIVQQRGGWAGDLNPQIVDVKEITDDNGVVMARCYSISPKGYVVVPVLKEMPPIKMYSEESDFDVNQPGGAPQMLREVLKHRTKYFIESYGSLEASQPAGEQGMFDRKHRRDWDFFTFEQPAMDGRLPSGETEAMTGVGPLLTTTWHQGAPYNNFCPDGDGGRTLVGCVATAMAQLMKYHDYPPNGTGSSSYYWDGDQSCDGNTAGQTLTVDHSDAYNWANMPDACGVGSPTVEQNAVAELNYEAAVACEMDFGHCGSGAFFSTMRLAFRDHFGYDRSIRADYRYNYTASAWFSLIQEQINEGLPMVYGIYSHAIVCDGWRIFGSLNQYHMNYGWSDSHTAWYTLDNLHCPWAGCDTMNESVTRDIVPPCVVFPSTVDFGTLAVGCTKDDSFFVINRTNSTLTGDVTESCDHFSILSGGGPFSLSADESLLVAVRYAPTATGDHECDVATATSECGDVHLVGEAISKCRVQPVSLNFGMVAVGDSTDLDFKIYNIGCTALTGSVSEPCLHYKIAAGGGAYSIPPGDSITVTVRFQPTAIGTWPCTIETGTECANVTCSGFGVEPPPAGLLEPDTLDFGRVDIGNYKIMTFDITNSGGGTMSGTMSETCDNFTIMSGGTYSLGHDESQTVSIFFLAASADPDECWIETGNDACIDLYCIANGVSEPPPECLVEPDTLDFATVIVGDSLDMNFDIINTGGGVLSGSVSDTCTCFDVVAGGGAYALSADETLHVTVRFKPDAGGSYECWVETGTADCVDVYCMGTGDDVSGLRMVDTKRFHLYQNYPNPFNPTTNITFTVPGSAHTTLSIYNIEGRLVKTLLDSDFEGGVKTVTWDGRDARGNPVSSGVYFYRLSAGNDVMTKKMILLK